MALDDQALRRLIRDGIASGLLPFDECTKILGGPSNGEPCDACHGHIEKNELVLECIIGDRPLLRAHLFHVRCFYIWDIERRTLGGGPSSGACGTA